MKLISLISKIFLCLVIIFSFTNVNAEEQCIEIYYKKKLIQKMLVSEFRALIAASKYSKQLIEAEKNLKVGRVKVFIEDDPLVIPEGKEITTRIKIIWCNDKGETIKIMVIPITLKHEKNKNKDSKFIIFYTKAAKVGFPISFGLSVILFLILIL